MIRVISRKVPRCDSMNFVMYINKLSETVKNQNGFVTSDSYWCRESNTVFSISDWVSENHWKNWYTSQDRQTIASEYTRHVQEEHFRVLYKTNHKYRDIFLL